MTGRTRREVERDYEPRVLPTGSHTNFEPRPSVADEEALTDDVRAREHREHLAAMRRLGERLGAIDRELDEALTEMRVLDRATQRDRDRIRQAIARISDRHVG